MKKIVDQTECKIQVHMDQRAHMQNQTDVSQAQARGSSIRRHVAAHQRRLEAVGPVECRPTTMVGRVSPTSTDPQPLGGSF